MDTCRSAQARAGLAAEHWILGPLRMWRHMWLGYGIDRTEVMDSLQGLNLSDALDKTRQYALEQLAHMDQVCHHLDVCMHVL